MVVYENKTTEKTKIIKLLTNQSELDILPSGCISSFHCAAKYLRYLLT